jgi:hypothetical protein
MLLRIVWSYGFFALLRQIVYALLLLGEGIVLDPIIDFGSTLAAAESVGYSAIGFEKTWILPLQRSRQQPAQEVLSKEDVDQQRRQRNHQRPGHLHIPLGELTAGQILQRNGHRA